MWALAPMDHCVTFEVSSSATLAFGQQELRFTASKPVETIQLGRAHKAVFTEGDSLIPLKKNQSE
ncbi:hypothetical protein ACTXT7_016371 [Hymenolepis weldensis]